MAKDRKKLPPVFMESPQTASVLDVLNRPGNDEERANKPIEIDESQLASISDFTQTKLSDIGAIRKLFPDIELSMQIVRSSIISPNDMETVSLVYNSENTSVPTDIKRSILEMIKAHISTNYGLEDKLATFVDEALFTHGAYIKAVIPETVVSNIINERAYNISMEALATKISKKIVGKPTANLLGEVGSPITVSLENSEGKEYTVNTSDFDENLLGIEITDNPALVMTNHIATKIALENTTDSLEAVRGITGTSKERKRDLTNLFKKTSTVKEMFIDVINYEGGKYTYGVPYITKLPVESVIPIHANGEPENHLGYFVLHDEKGTPLKKSDFKDTRGTHLVNLATNHTILDRANAALEKVGNTAPKITDSEEVYGRLVDSMLKTRLSKGTLGSVATISDDLQDIYRVMFQRTLASKKTKILFLPKNMVSYYAFNYRENGTGESLLENLTVLASIRAILMFTRINAAVKNSTTTTVVEVDLDDDMRDPVKIMNKVMSTVLKTRESALPIGMNRVEDIVDWIRKAGIKFKFNHKDLPNMNIVSSEETTSKIEPDDNLEELIRKFMLMRFSLPPKLVEDGYDSDFAATVIQNNILFSKRMTQERRKLAKMVTNDVKIIIEHDEVLREKIRQMIKGPIRKIIKGFDEPIQKYLDSNNYTNDELADTILDMFAKDIVVTFPTTEKTNTEGMKEAFEAYVDIVDEFIEHFVSTDALPEDVRGTMGDLDMDYIGNAIKSELIRKWMSDNNFLPEANMMFAYDEDNQPLYDVMGGYSDYLERVTETFYRFMKNRKKLTEKANERFAKIDEEDSDEDNEEAAAGDATTENTDGAQEEETDTVNADNDGVTDTGDDMGQFDEIQ